MNYNIFLRVNGKSQSKLVLPVIPNQNDIIRIDKDSYKINGRSFVIHDGVLEYVNLYTVIIE